jgi:hypothetical protein
MNGKASKEQQWKQQYRSIVHCVFLHGARNNVVYFWEMCSNGMGCIGPYIVHIYIGQIESILHDN